MTRDMPLLPVGLSLLSAGLVLLLLAQLFWPPAPLGEAAVVAPQASMAGLPDYEPPAVEAFDVLRARPPFSPLRRPGPRPEEAEDASAEPVPQLHLLGVISDEKIRIAVARVEPSNEVLNLRPGTAIGGWQVVEVGEDRLLLQRGDKTHEIWLDGAPRQNGAGGEGLRRVNAERSQDD